MIAEIRFLRPASVRRPSTMTIVQREFQHDLVVAHIAVEQGGSTRYNHGTPVDVRWGVPPNNINQFYGYVHHTEPIYTRGGPLGRTQTLKLVCIGASYRLKQPEHRVWANRTVSSVVRQVVNDVKFSGDVQQHDVLWESVVNDGKSRWMFLVEQAQRIGYTFFVTNTDVHFHDRVTRYQKEKFSAAVFRAKQPNETGGSVYAFHGVIGETTPDGGERAIRLLQGVDSRFTRPIRVQDRGGSLVQDQLAQVSVAPDFVKYETGTPVTSPGVAEAVLEGVVRNNRWQYVAKAEVVGNTRVRQGSTVFFDGLGPRDSGYWYVEGVEHVVKNNDYRMYLELGRDSSFITHSRPSGAERRVIRQRLDPFESSVAVTPPTTMVGGVWRSSWGAKRAVA